MEIRKKIRKEWEGFKDFAMKDNAVILAVGVIIGVAFKDLVDAVVNNIFTPPIGYLTAKIDFAELFVTLGSKQYDTLVQAQEAGAVVLQYGLVLNSLITFSITAIILYIVVRGIKRATAREEKEVKKSTKPCPYCMSDINIKAKKCPFCTSSVK